MNQVYKILTFYKKINLIFNSNIIEFILKKFVIKKIKISILPIKYLRKKIKWDNYVLGYLGHSYSPRDC